MATDLDLVDQVSFNRSIVPTPHLARLIKAADLGLVPYHNGVFTGGILPTKLMEYAAVGLPAIAARTTAISAYFDDDMVEFFAPGDVDDLVRCIRRLYSDRQRLADLAQGIRRFSERHNWPRESETYVGLVERLARGKEGKG
jgi:glycosyltransferase involved in cell wall biosynthesis